VAYVKDVDGIHAADPATDPSAAQLRRVSIAELGALPTAPVGRILADLLPRARHIREVQIVNGSVPGSLTKAPAGERARTILHR
jgi:molybdenum storage protein